MKFDIFSAFPATVENPNGFAREPLEGLEGYQSYSRVKTMAQSMAHYKRRYIDKIVPEDTPDKEFGRFMHAMLLEPEKFLVSHVIKPSKEDYPGLLNTVDDLKAACAEHGIQVTSKMKKADLEKRLAAQDPLLRERIWSCIMADHKNRLTDGIVELTKGQADQIMSMIVTLNNSIIGQKKVRNLLQDGFSEVCAYWQDAELGVTWFIRLDYIRPIRLPDGSFLYWLTDLKTTRDASFDGFKREIATYGYHLQNWIYRRVVKGITGARVNLTNIALEKEDPIGVGVYEPEDRADETAAFQVRNLLDRWRWCLSAGRWPKYAERILKSGPANWYYWQVEQQAEMEAE